MTTVISLEHLKTLKSSIQAIASSINIIVPTYKDFQFSITYPVPLKYTEARHVTNFHCRFIILPNQTQKARVLDSQH